MLWEGQQQPRPAQYTPEPKSYKLAMYIVWGINGLLFAVAFGMAAAFMEGK